jgi:hypothetical protein
MGLIVYRYVYISWCLLCLYGLEHGASRKILSAIDVTACNIFGQDGDHSALPLYFQNIHNTLKAL